MGVLFYLLQERGSVIAWEVSITEASRGTGCVLGQFNPSFSDWVQNVPRPGIFLLNICRCQFFCLFTDTIIIRHVYCFLRVVCFFFQIQLDLFLPMLV
jgi:hypothetical protein